MFIILLALAIILIANPKIGHRIPVAIRRSFLVIASLAMIMLLIGELANTIPEPKSNSVAESSLTSSDDESDDPFSSDESLADDDEDEEESSSSSSSSEYLESTSESSSVSEEPSTTAATTSTQENSVVESNSSEASSEHSYSAVPDTRPENNERSRYSYEYQPPHEVNSGQIVYVNPTISGHYHLDPNCSGLIRHGGGTPMTIEEARAQGYGAECTYERYGKN